MNLFGGIRHEGDRDLDTLPPIPENCTENELLDYLVLVIARHLSCNVAFKGGYMLNQLIPTFSRVTHDIDFSVSEKSNYNEVTNVLRTICDKFKNENYIESYKIKEIADLTHSGGVDMYDSDGKKILGVDVGIHDISFGITHYNLSFTDVDGFNVERMLADKLTAITTRKRFRRTKDLYDFYVITNYFDVDLDKLSDYVGRRGNVEWDNIPFDDTIIVQYQRAWDKLNIEIYDDVSAFKKPDFDIVLRRFYQIAMSIKLKLDVHKWESKNERCI